VRRLIAVALLLSLVGAGAGGAWLGLRAGDFASRPGEDRLVLVAPETMAGPAEGALRSAGGFTGFGGAPALAGDVGRVGIVEEHSAGDGDAGELRVVGEAGEARLRYSVPARLFRIQPIDQPVVPGDVVVLRYEGDRFTGILRVPPDIEEGIGRSETPRQRGIEIPD
jgi:hypothetical protein